MRKADYTLYVHIKRDDFLVKDVRCKIYLPERLTDSIELRFFPTAEQSSAIRDPSEFAIEGMIKESDDFVSTRIHANKIYRISSSISYYPSDITEGEIIGTPRDLEIEHFNFTKDQKETETRTSGTLWLTQSNFLLPGKTLDRSYTGEVSVDLFKKLELKLANDFQLAFDKYYRYKDCDRNEFITFSELVAEFEFEGGKNEIPSNLQYVDDFLMLVSFAERQRCVCLGWDATDSTGSVQNYRREMAIPDTNTDHEFDYTLIDKQDFEKFIRTAYQKFIELEPKDLIREAIQKAIYRKGDTIGSSLISLYSALETTVLFFQRSQKQLEHVFPRDDGEQWKQWKEIRKNLEIWLEEHPLLKDDENKQKLMKAKIPELNRVSFRNAFKKLVKYYSINLDDLWPVLDDKKGISLQEIRNKLVHGEVFYQAQHQSLMVATEHLRWIVERAILSILGWDISQSKVSNKFLFSVIEFNKEWKTHRDILSN